MWKTVDGQWTFSTNDRLFAVRYVTFFCNSGFRRLVDCFVKFFFKNGLQKMVVHWVLTDIDLPI